MAKKHVRESLTTFHGIPNEVVSEMPIERAPLFDSQNSA